MRTDRPSVSPARLLPRLLLCAAPAIAVALAPPARVGAQQAPPGGAAPHAAPAVSPIAAFVDDSAVMVARIDLGRIDWDALADWEIDLLRATPIPQKSADEVSGRMRRQMPLVKKWAADFVRAGGKTVYVVGRLNPDAPGYLVVPLGAGADPEALAGLLKDPFALSAAAGEGGSLVEGLKSEVIGRTLYFGAAQALSDVKEMTPAARPELEQALGDTGDAPLGIAFNPSDGLRGMIVLSQRNLPQRLGGGPAAPVANGLRWASLSLRPPTARAGALIRLTVQAKDAAAARTLAGVVDAAHRSAPVTRESGAAASPVQWLFDALAPQVAADRPDQLRLSLDDAKMKDLVARLLPALGAARTQAARVRSSNNERQILLAVLIYAGEHENALPKSFPADLRAELGPDEKAVRDLFTNPARPNRPQGYVYARPAEKVTDVKEPNRTPVVWEAFDAWGDGVNVGFMDGHVEFVRDREDFERMLKNNPGAPADGGGGGGGGAVRP